MHRSFLPIVFILFFLSSCMPAPLTLVPPETLAAQTLAAMPSTATPLPTATDLPTSTVTPPGGPPTPTLDLGIPGAYCLPTNTPRIQGLVTRVVSGDMIDVVITNQTYRVRFIGVASPSILAPGEWQAAQAMSFNQNLVKGKIVTLVQDVTEVYNDGVYPRYVLIDQTFVNYEVVRQGFGKILSAPPDTACDQALLAAQVEAQSAVRGVWIATPMPTYTITLTPTITRTPTKTSVPVCDCQGPRLTCNDFRNQTRAQLCFEYCRSLGFGDIFYLDKNNNGLACEGS